MKAYNKLNLGLLVLLIALMNACTKDFKELNTNPALVTEDLVTPEFLLSGVQYGIGGGLGASDIGDYCGMTVRVDNAPFVDGFDDGAWYAAYTSYANNLAAIVRKTENDPELVNKNAIARILKVWVYSQATDIYGDMPYLEANKSPDEAIPAPKYDTQKTIYQDFFKELSEAASALDASKKSFGNADLYYGGNTTKWKKFANSLRLRLALRLRYVDPQMAKQNLSDLQEADLILSRSDDAAIFTTDDIEAHRNADYTRIANGNDPAERQDFVGHQLVGKALLDALVGSSVPSNPLDPRTKVIADTAQLDGSTLIPPHAPFGFRAQPLLGSVPVENKYPYGSGSVSLFSLFGYVPVVEKPILRSSEVYFALAEAALFNLRTGDANTYFRNGITASIEEVRDFYMRGKSQMPALLELVYGSGFDVAGYLDYKEMKQSEIDAFLASGVTTLVGSDEEKLEQIINQKLIALPNSLEGWSEWRRTGYPRVLVDANEQSTLAGVSPRRKHYPNSESLINSKNFQEAIDRLGGKDDLLKRVWWDANPDAPHKHPGMVESMANPWK
ncbi:MAG: SusD/RagB family nutrient-binding outer membrane lipoprotein [Saprospiraceae bacterium]|nr:SusD/RagB family nutrient-binding outer membrane lipoprotein [Saprospiraceae bacterium]